MSKRIQIEDAQPNAYKAMYALENFIQQSDLEKKYIELIKLRASQINGCAFCLDMHVKDALKLGETTQRMMLLDAWKESDLFDETEQIILELTESITLVSQKGLPDDLYNRALSLLGESTFALVVMAIVTINAWNRIAISTHKPIPA